VSSQDERYAKAVVAFGDGDLEVADELLSAVEQADGPIAAAADLRQRLTDAVARRRIAELRQAAGRLVAQGEYELASGSLSRAKELESELSPAASDDSAGSSQPAAENTDHQPRPSEIQPDIAVMDGRQPPEIEIIDVATAQPALHRPMDWQALASVADDAKAAIEQTVREEAIEPSKLAVEQTSAERVDPSAALLRSLSTASAELAKLRVGQWLNRKTLTATILASLVFGVLAFFGLRGLGGNSVTQSIDPAVAAIEIPITASEPGATILVDGVACGTGSCLSNLAPGSYELEAKLAGYSAAFRQLTIPSTGLEDPGPIVLPLIPLATSLEVSGNLDSADVVLDGESIGAFADGLFVFDALPTGTHRLEIRSARSSVGLDVTVSPGQAPAIGDQTTATKLAWAAVGGLGASATVYTGNANAKLLVEGADPLPFEGNSVSTSVIGDEPQNAVIEAGRRKYQISLENITASSLRLFLESDQPIGTLRIATGVDDATVYFNGSAYRRKTRNGRLLVYLYPNTYRVRVEKDGFVAPPLSTVTIEDGKNIQLDLPLRPQLQTATLTVSKAVPGTDVLIDGKLRGKVDASGRFSTEGVAVGSHTIVLREELHADGVYKRDFEPGAVVEIGGDQQSIAGILQITVTPDSIDAALTIQREGEASPRRIGERTLKLPAGTYTVKAVAAGVEPFAATVRLQPNEVKTVRLELIKKRAPATRKPTFQFEDWITSGDWRREGEFALRRGGGLKLASRQLGLGRYEFSARLDRGKRLEWRVPFVDSNNFVAYQLDKAQFQRQATVNGKKLPRLRQPHGVDLKQFVSLRIVVRGNSIAHQIYRDDAWVTLDEMKQEGAAFEVGHFGFRIPRNDQVSLRTFQFVPASESAASSE
jgi:hypothetical protein